MRFQKLHVENFKAIKSADLELGPGLNVLYGPNDLGKSTLGETLRAALLLPSDSSVADSFVPWHEAVEPLVTLTFLDDTEKWWRVSKRFTKKDSTIAFSKDGVEFTADVKGRAVEEKLRSLLRWGIAGPGGKSGTRGMPDSFLAQALLAAQTNVSSILKESLEGDHDDGRVRLTKALSALAQDPLVRHVLTRAQQEADTFFTPTGRRKGGKNSPIARASDEVKALTRELVEVQHALHESKALEDEVTRLHEAWLAAQHAAELAVDAHRKALASQQRAGEKRAALAKLAHEQQALSQVEGFLSRLASLDAELASLARTVSEREAALEAARQANKRAEDAVRDAEEAQRQASSADGEAARAVELAQLKQDQATRQAKRIELEARLEKATAARKAAEERKRLADTVTKLDAQLAPARAKLSAAQDDLALITAIIQYGHWRRASDAVKQAEPWRAQAQAARTQANDKAAEATGAREQAASARAEATALSLPDEKERAAFERVRRDLELAEASLGGGVTVLVKPRSQLLLRSTADEGSLEERKLTHEHAIEADRRVQVSIGDLVDIEVIAGAAEKRKDAEHLRKKWKSEVLPALEKHGVRTLPELQELVAKQTALLDRARALDTTAQQAEREAEALRERAGTLDERIASAPTAQQLEEKRKLVGPLDFALLEQAFSTMGASWETDTRGVQQARTAAVTDAQAALTKLESDLAVTQARLADTKAPAVTEEPSSLELQLTTLGSESRAADEKVRQLELAGSSAVKAAAERLEQVKQQRLRADEAMQAAATALDETRKLVGTRQGERNATASQLAQADEGAVRARVATAQREAEAFADVQLLSDAEVDALHHAAEQARAAAEHAGRAHADADGQLKKVGGPQAREQLRSLEEALAAAKAREHLLEVDAESWKLLAETLREAEKNDSSSLGAALSAPVTSRFAQLTKNRYGTVQFDAQLRATGLDVAGTQASPDGVIDALSVGTRDQLAMLVRLAIALQLQSAIVLDDHLVHTDLGRLEWFRDALRATAEKTQVLVLTCRPLDYVKPDELPTKGASRDLDARFRVVDLAKVITRR
jgi:energy-coupling factor transporter ATP-binding protein EcfA2